MKSYLVAVHILSEEASLDEISDVLGIGPDANSYNRGDVRGTLETECEETLWKLESCADEAASLEEHLASLRSELPLSRLLDPRLPADRTITLDIAIMYDTFTCSVQIDAELLRPFVDAGAGIAISCYPTDFTK